MGNSAPDLMVLDHLETWRHSAHVNALRLSDPHEAKGQELQGIGQHRRADRIRGCSHNPRGRNANDHLGWKCKDAQCPSCSAKKANRRGWEVARIVGALEAPQHLIAHALSRRYQPGDADDATAALAEAVEEAYTALAGLRRLQFVRDGIRGGVAAPEVVVNERLHRWDVHFHIIADAPDLDLARADSYWRQNVKRGSLVRDLDDIKSPKKLAYYIVKAEHWSPAPGELGAAELSALTTVMRGKHRYRAWGVAKEAKVRLVDEPTARIKKARRHTRDLERDPVDTFDWMYPDTGTQADIIDQALERAAELTASEDLRDHLELIAWDFLATNSTEVLRRDPKLMNKMFTRVEKLLGLALVVFDKEEVIFGLPTLERAAHAP